MDISGLIQRSWNLVWNNKWLILLGVLVAIGGGGFSSGGGSNFSSFQGGQGQTGDNGDFGDIPAPTQEEIDQFLEIGVPIILAVSCFVIIIVLALYVVGRISTGGLIAGIDQLDAGAVSSFSQAWSAGWQKASGLIGIGLIAALPGLLFLVVALALFVPTLLAASTLEQGFADFVGGSFVFIVIGMACLTFLVSIPLGLLRGMADRALMLENTGVIASYSRAWEILSAHLGDAVLIAVVQIGASIVLGFALIIPSILAVIPVCCCIVIPLLLAVQGGVTAILSSMWTLAWRGWTGRGALTGPSADFAPAV